MKISRRTFIFVGAAGAAALLVARFVPRGAPAADSLGADGLALMTAVAPVMLAGAIPADPAERSEALRDTLAGIERAVAGLAPRAQAELADLFSLLALAPARWSLAHMSAAWPDASPAHIEAFLARLRDSRIGLMRAAYDALHQLVMAAWYGNPRAWAAIGYAGPPMVG